MQTGAVAHSMHIHGMHAQLLSQARGPKYFSWVSLNIGVNFWTSRPFLEQHYVTTEIHLIGRRIGAQLHLNVASKSS